MSSNALRLARGPRDMSPRTVARITGAVYLLLIVLGGIGQSIADRLVVAGDAAATAATILTHVPQMRLAFAIFLVEMLSQIAVTALFFDLLRPVSRSVARIALFIGLGGIAIKTFSRLFFIAPVALLGGAGYLAAFTTEQLQALALFLLKLNAQGTALAMVFFGSYAIILGYLVFRSTFLPRWLGVLGIVCGLGWLLYLYPPLADRFVTIIVVAGVIGAAAKIAWLLAVGVNEERWIAQHEAATASIWP